MQPRSISNHIRLEAERVERSEMAGAKEKEKTIKRPLRSRYLRRARREI